MANNSCKDLPDEVWELILNKLHQRHHSLLESPSLSCKRFLSITNALRTRLSIVDRTTIPLSTLFSRFPNLNSVHLRFFSPGDLGRVIADIATSGLNLRTLNFTGTDGLPLESCRFLGSRMKNIRVLICLALRTLRDIELVVIADSMPCLEDLDISFPENDFGSDPELQGRTLGEVGVTDSGIESLIALSTNCVYLKEISVLGCHLLTLFGIGFVLRNSTNLSLLSVGEIDFGQLDDFSIRWARNLSTLNIYNSVVSDECLHLLANAGIPLKKFTLSHFVHSSFTFSGISSLLNKYRSLKGLSLVRIDFLTDEKMSGLSQCLSAVVTISLDGCDNLTESTFFMLAKNCPLLVDIRMQGTNLGGGGDKTTDIVKNPRINLEVPVVSSCKGITEKGIADFLKSGSKLRSLRIDECGGIKNIGNGFELSELDFIGAARSGINDDGLVLIGNRCLRLLNLNLDGYLGVTIVGLKEILTNCERLRKINLTGCLNVCTETADWMVFSRPSLRKIILPHSYLPSESQRQLFLHCGCLVLSK
ncbi:hypothetical protein RHSIM_Rhsim06G0127600 [Rhododendron simsii]|uniref:Uncharacterized protein n=1 Tax=Rhododendron simsii TaxID=118357 RepID=A0A834LK40_RHOSS|nr:hypothetical protein RHSIM_Rhsim06G0127600 [Rhododendron simsii]